MVDQIAEKLYHQLVRTFPPTSSYSLADLASRNLRLDLYRYLSFVLEERASSEVDRIRLPESSWFDYSEPSLHTDWADFVVKLKKYPVFPSDHWAEELDKAVSVITGFTLTPVNALVLLLFEGSQPVHPARVPGFVERFETHDFVRDAASKAVSTRDVGDLDSEDFAGTVRSISSDFINGSAESSLLELLQPVLNIVRDASGTDLIPVDIATSFFDDIGCRAVADRLHRHAERYHLDAMDKDQLVDGLSLSRPTQSIAPGAAAETSTEVTEPSIEQPNFSDTDPVQNETVVQHEKSDDSSEENDKPAPLWKAFQQKLNAPVNESSGKSAILNRSRPETPAQSLSTEQVSEPLSEYVDSTSPTVPIWERFRSRTTSARSPEDFGSAELRVLGESVRLRRDEYISSMFGNSADEYHDVIVVLDGLTDWDGASQYIAEHVFRKHRVNIYSEVAVSFTNAVEQRYKAIQTD